MLYCFAKHIYHKMTSSFVTYKIVSDKCRTGYETHRIASCRVNVPAKFNVSTENVRFFFMVIGVMYKLFRLRTFWFISMILEFFVWLTTAVLYLSDEQLLPWTRFGPKSYLVWFNWTKHSWCIYLHIFIAFSFKMIVQEEEIHQAMHSCNAP